MLSEPVNYFFLYCMLDDLQCLEDILYNPYRFHHYYNTRFANRQLVVTLPIILVKVNIISYAVFSIGSA